MIIMTGIPEDTQTLHHIPLDEVIPTEALEEQPLTLAKHQQRLIINDHDQEVVIN